MEEKKQKKLHPLVLAVIILVAVALLLCAAAAGLWLHGRSSLHTDEVAPTLPVTDSSSTSQEEEPTQASYVEYQGKRYKYNSNMINILLLGIDSNAENATVEYDAYTQADVLVLAALDLSANKMTLIALNRDTMCDIQLVDDKGNPTALMNTQLALAYAYGDGSHQSCQLTKDAVSNIFFGLPIQGYGAYYLEGISDLNNAVGGVTVTITDDYPFTLVPGGQRMTAGRQLTLNGREARLFVQSRLPEIEHSHALRMQRQKQYMLSLISKTKQLLKDNPATVLQLYSSVDDFILTNLDIGEIGYLALKAASMEFSQDIVTLSGEFTVDEESHQELHLDRDALYNLMLDVFYEEVTD